MPSNFLQSGRQRLKTLLPSSMLRKLRRFRSGDRCIGLNIDLADGCNLRCVMCVLHSRQRSKNRLISEPVLQQLLAAAPELNYIGLQCNCEPLLNKNAADIVSRLKAANPALQVTLVTNGMLLTQEISEALIAAGIDEIGISFDGSNKATFEKLRVGADMDRIISNVKTLIKTRIALSKTIPAVRFVTVSMKENLAELMDILKLARELGVERWTINGLESYSPATASLPLYTRRPESSIVALFASLRNKAKSMGISLTVAALRHKKTRFCMLSSSVVDTDGKVYPCPPLSYERPYFTEGKERKHSVVTFGNLNQASYSQIWNSDEYRGFRYKCAKGKLDGVCKGCLIKDGVICPL